MNVSIVLNYCSPADTIRCVNSILDFCGDVDFIVIVDNNSPDESYSMLINAFNSCKFPNVYILKNERNDGYGGGNNFGIKWALNNLSVDNFWIVNSDAYVIGDSFAPMLRALKSGRYFVGSVNVDPKTNLIECYGGGTYIPLLGKSILLGKGRPLDDISSIDKKKLNYIMGCSLAFSSSLIKDIGYMDDAYFMYSEEVDWQISSKKYGYELFVAVDSIVFHEGSKSLGGRSKFYYYYINRAAIRYNKKFYGLTFALVSFPFLVLITFIKNIKNPENIMVGFRGAIAGFFLP